jgi:hypothetical protein
VVHTQLLDSSCRAGRGSTKGSGTFSPSQQVPSRRRGGVLGRQQRQGAEHVPLHSSSPPNLACMYGQVLYLALCASRETEIRFLSNREKPLLPPALPPKRTGDENAADPLACIGEFTRLRDRRSLLTVFSCWRRSQLRFGSRSRSASPVGTSN